MRTVSIVGFVAAGLALIGCAQASAQPEAPRHTESTVYCNPITNKAGATLELYSERRGAEFVGCQDANTVMAAYLALPPEEYEGSGRFVNDLYGQYDCATGGTDRITCVTEQGLTFYATLQPR